MKKETIKSNELKRLITMKSNKIYFEDVDDMDIDKIEEITLNGYLINGENSKTNIIDALIFKNLKKININKFEITDEDIRLFSKIEKLEQIEIVRCKFRNVNFENLNKNIKFISFTNCDKLLFKYPKVNEVRVTKCTIDFNNIDFANKQNIFIQNSIILNAHNLIDFKNINNVNLDGSILYNEKGKELSDILVYENTDYSHEKELKYYDV